MTQKLIQISQVTRPKLKLLGQNRGEYTNFKLTLIMLKASFDHLFATYSYTSYWRVGKFLTNSNRRSSYSPKFAKNYLKRIFLQYVLNCSFRKSSIVCKRRQQPRLESRSSRSRSRRMKTRGSLGAERKHTPPRASLLSETLSFSCV